MCGGIYENVINWESREDHGKPNAGFNRIGNHWQNGDNCSEQDVDDWKDQMNLEFENYVSIKQWSKMEK